MIILRDAEKAFDKIQYIFLLETPSTQGIEGKFLKLKYEIYFKKLQLNIYLMVKE